MDGFDHPLGSLKALCSLQVLRVSFRALLRGVDDSTSHYLVDLLPYSLQSLEVIGIAHRAEGELQERFLLALMADERFSSLTSIRVDRNRPFPADLANAEWDVSTSGDHCVVLRRRELS